MSMRSALWKTQLPKQLYGLPTWLWISGKDGFTREVTLIVGIESNTSAKVCELQGIGILSAILSTALSSPFPKPLPHRWTKTSMGVLKDSRVRISWILDNKGPFCNSWPAFGAPLLSGLQPCPPGGWSQHASATWQSPSPILWSGWGLWALL